MSNPWDFSFTSTSSSDHSQSPKSGQESFLSWGSGTLWCLPPALSQLSIPPRLVLSSPIMAVAVLDHRFCLSRELCLQVCENTRYSFWLPAPFLSAETAWAHPGHQDQDQKEVLDYYQDQKEVPDYSWEE